MKHKFFLALIVLALTVSPLFVRGQMSDTCADGKLIVMDATNKRYKCLSADVPLRYKLSSVSLNSANTDAITLTNLPSKYIVRKITITNASTSLTTATLGVFTGAGGTGTTIAAAATLTALTGATKFSDLTITLSADSTVASTLYFRNVLAQGSAATVDIYIEIQGL